MGYLVYVFDVLVYGCLLGREVNVVLFVYVLLEVVGELLLLCVVVGYFLGGVVVLLVV